MTPEEIAKLPNYLRSMDLIKITGLHKSTVHVMMNDPAFPLTRYKKVKLVQRDEFFAYMESLKVNKTA